MSSRSRTGSSPPGRLGKSPQPTRAALAYLGMARQHRPSRGVDDWFAEPDSSAPRDKNRVAVPAEPEAPTLERLDDDWLGGREAGRTRKRRTPAPLGANARVLGASGLLGLVLLLVGLTAGGVFSSESLPKPRSTLSLRTTPPPPTGTKAVAVPIPTATLKPGAHGPAVKVLQRALARLGYAPGAVDGQYGAGTKQALSKFQQAHQLAADGILGPATLAALTRALRQHG